jgi:hypothetical protein
MRHVELALLGLVLLTTADLRADSPAVTHADMPGGWRIGARLQRGSSSDAARNIVLDARRYEEAEISRSPDTTGTTVHEYGGGVWGGDIRLYSPWSWGISVGYRSGPESKLDVNQQYVTGQNAEEQLRLAESRIPISFFYLHSRSRLAAEARMGLTLARGDLDWSETSGSGRESEVHTQGSGDGLHIGGEVALQVTEGLELFVGVDYVWVEMENFTGRAGRSDVRSVYTEEDQGRRIHAVPPIFTGLPGARDLEYHASGARLSAGISAAWPRAR